MKSDKECVGQDRHMYFRSYPRNKMAHRIYTKL